MSCLGKICIQCNAGNTLPLNELVDFQENLIKRTAQDVKNCKDRLVEAGFSYPFLVWKADKNYCFDIRGEIFALKTLESEGYELPTGFPVVYIDAVDEKEAKEKLLQANSSYGVITREGLAEFTDGIDIELKSMSFTDSYIDFSGNVFSEEGELSPRQNAMKVAVFGKYQIPISENEIQLFQARLTEYGTANGGLKGFFDHFLTKYSLEKQQEIN
jgi:hypothetical protein